MAMKKRNVTVSFERLGTTPDASGDIGGTRTVVLASWLCRIVWNAKFDEASIQEDGAITVSSHIAMGNVDTGLDLVKIGDMLIDNNGKEYIVNLVDLNPGGTQAGDKIHHAEIFIRHSSVKA
jgi:hypothetical protein